MSVPGSRLSDGRKAKLRFIGTELLDERALQRYDRLETIVQEIPQG